MMRLGVWRGDSERERTRLKVWRRDSEQERTRLVEDLKTKDSAARRSVWNLAGVWKRKLV